MFHLPVMLVCALGAMRAAPPATETPEPPATSPALATIFHGEVTLVGDGYTFTEGPCWIPGTPAAAAPDEKPNAQPDAKSAPAPAGTPGYFIFCDRSPADGGVVYRWTGEGKPTPWRTPAGLAIGAAVGDGTSVVFAETQDRRITRVPIVDGTPGQPTVLAASFEGKRLNATNDLVVKRDGSVYFTDPTFFTPKPALELDFNGVYRVTPDGTLTLLDRFGALPNGLCFSPDESRLYVNDFGNNKVMVYDVAPDGTLGNKRLFADLTTLGIESRGRADGLRCDVNGNVYTTGPLGIIVLSPDGAKITSLTVPNASNLAFGGSDGRTLLITAGRSVYRVNTAHAGAPR
ncbi:MAG: SMP-30/gluconolactonase/LRE family protein [Planctomycetota bacterium]|nr:SMP-30/gluconolactonase/LRE family protein [Planctomycetota bacterium]